MQDTFYLNDPEKVEVAPEMLDLWAKVHEHGHDTGSKGWGVKFDKRSAKGLTADSYYRQYNTSYRRKSMSQAEFWYRSCI